MDYKRAAWMTFLLYIASFAVGIFVAPYLGYDFSTSEATTEVFLFGIVSTIVLIIIFTRWYFSSPKIQTTLENGIKFGLFVIGISFLLDFAVILPTLMSSTSAIDPLAYYTHPLFWVTIAAIPIASGVTASYMQKNTSAKKPSGKKKTTRKKKKK